MIMTNEQKIQFIVDAQMIKLNKLKKADLQDICRDLLADYMRELADDTISDMYNESFFGNV